MEKVEPLIEEINKITNNEYKFILKSATLDEAADFCVIEIFYKDGIILEKEIKEKVENRILNAEDYIKDNEKYISMANTLAALGVPFSTKIVQDGKGNFHFSVGTNDNKRGSFIFDGQNSPIQKALDYQMQNMKNSADLLQKDNDWYTADKISGLALSLLPNFNFSFGKKLK